MRAIVRTERPQNPANLVPQSHEALLEPSFQTLRQFHLPGFSMAFFIFFYSFFGKYIKIVARRAPERASPP